MLSSAKLKLSRNSRASHRYAAQSWLWVAVVALIYGALSPALLALNQPAQRQLFTLLCTQAGMVKVATEHPIKMSDDSSEHSHTPQCSWCGNAATGLLPDIESVCFAPSRHPTVRRVLIVERASLAQRLLPPSRGPPLV
jgi:hypothetical protein